ncbi:MAG TPA: type II toxin-antitoxin system HicB family antitoxin [Thermoplasmata archaeon]|nr:type II toxin-antitoxin system HicB family antitoxin [Thermoplasmata archaeon]
MGNGDPWSSRSSSSRIPRTGAIVASCPALPGCHSQGETLEEARRNIRDAIHLCLEVLNKRSDAPVKPFPVGRSGLEPACDLL